MSLIWKTGEFSIVCNDIAESRDFSTNVHRRYDELERRLTWITDTVKYALEVAKDYKTINIERLIVLLIACELSVAVGHSNILQPIIDFFTKM